MKAKIFILTALIPLGVQAGTFECDYFLDRFKSNHAKSTMELERKSKSIYTEFALDALENMIVHCDFDKETGETMQKLRKKLIAKVGKRK